MQAPPCMLLMPVVVSSYCGLLLPRSGLACVIASIREHQRQAPHRVRGGRWEPSLSSCAYPSSLEVATAPVGIACAGPPKTVSP
eukprot:1403658-Amphidinium_carterae.1